jgi:hypothetical protein
MCDIDRRDFILLSSAGAAGLGLTGAAVSPMANVLEADRPVYFLGDGLNLGPREYPTSSARRGPSSCPPEPSPTTSPFGSCAKPAAADGW